jgi:hypothetical protein
LCAVGILAHLVVGGNAGTICCGRRRAPCSAGRHARRRAQKTGRRIQPQCNGFRAAHGAGVSDGTLGNTRVASAPSACWDSFHRGLESAQAAPNRHVFAARRQACRRAQKNREKAPTIYVINYVGKMSYVTWLSGRGRAPAKQFFSPGGNAREKQPFVCETRGARPRRSGGMLDRG